MPGSSGKKITLIGIVIGLIPQLAHASGELGEVYDKLKKISSRMERCPFIEHQKFLDPKVKPV
jgi:hypothetical protein